MHYSFDWAAISDDRLLKINFIIYFAMKLATKKIAKKYLKNMRKKPYYTICVSSLRVWYAYFLHRRLLNQSNRLCDSMNGCSIWVQFQRIMCSMHWTEWIKVLMKRNKAMNFERFSHNYDGVFYSLSDIYAISTNQPTASQVSTHILSNSAWFQQFSHAH